MIAIIFGWILFVLCIVAISLFVYLYQLVFRDDRAVEFTTAPTCPYCTSTYIEYKKARIHFNCHCNKCNARFTMRFRNGDYNEPE